jgi:hypothetical protein
VHPSVAPCQQVRSLCRPLEECRVGVLDERPKVVKGLACEDRRLYHPEGRADAQRQ